ncbi:MAG: hypothetical protein CBC73_04490 [Flavobacteriales bacterium TMED113]|nr:MAG: hypothetical protein CBC73_04490 [Flavobacteriales bacterium TMED113]
MRLISIFFARFFARFFDKNFKSFNSLKNKREVIAWSFYDFANQPFTTIIITFVYSAYFVDYICPPGVNGMALWSMGISITAIIVSILSPILGAIADRGGFRKFFLVISTWLCIVATACLFFFQKGDHIVALVYLIIANIGFELGTVICNSYLPQLTTKKNIGRISGFAWGLGFVGGLISLIIILAAVFLLPMVFTDSINVTEKVIRSSNIFVALWFAVFSIPVFFLIKEKKADSLTNIHIKESILSIFKTFKAIKKYKVIARFLIARLFYNDALITIFALGGVYAVEALNFSYIEILVLGVVLNICAASGSFIFGRVEDKIGPKKTIEWSILILIIAVQFAYLSPELNSIGLSKHLFWLAGILLGLMTGPAQSCSRSLMARLTPRDKINEFFGFYAFTGKATSFLGPFLFGILVYNFSPQAGLLAVLALFIVGYLIFQTVYIDKLNYRYILSYLVIVLIIMYELVYLFSPEILNIF